MVINQVFDNNAVPICFAANNGFLPFTGVMVQSIIDHANKNDNYDIVVLCSNARARSMRCSNKISEKVLPVSFFSRFGT